MIVLLACILMLIGLNYFLCWLRRFNFYLTIWFVIFAIPALIALAIGVGFVYDSRHPEPCSGLEWLVFIPAGVASCLLAINVLFWLPDFKRYSWQETTLYTLAGLAMTIVLLLTLMTGFIPITQFFGLVIDTMLKWSR